MLSVDALARLRDCLIAFLWNGLCGRRISRAVWSHVLKVTFLPRLEILDAVDHSLDAGANERRGVDHAPKSFGPDFFNQAALMPINCAASASVRAVEGVTIVAVRTSTVCSSAASPADDCECFEPA